MGHRYSAVFSSTSSLTEMGLSALQRPRLRISRPGIWSNKSETPNLMLEQPSICCAFLHS